MNATRITVSQQIAIALLWFAYNVQWGALLPVVVPAQVAAIAGAHKEIALGLVMNLGGLVALIVAPLAGAWSDNTYSASGRRRPFLIWFGLATVLALLVLGVLPRHTRIANFVFAYVLLGIVTNGWGGAYAGLIPDVVPPGQRGFASGWMAAMTLSGTVLGAVVCGALVQRGAFFAAYAFIALVLVVCLGLTLTFVHERPSSTLPRDARRSFRAFFPPWRQNPDFYRVLFTRSFVTMGVYSVYEFYIYFLGDVVHVRTPLVSGGILLGIAALVGAPAALFAGRLADRIGAFRVVVYSASIMSAAAFAYVAVVFAPSWSWTVIIAIIYGMGTGAYQAVDWALAIRVLPSSIDAGKDMGIWHASLVFPQAIAPGLTGLILTAFKPHSLQLGYAAAFILAAFWLLLGTVFILQLSPAARDAHDRRSRVFTLPAKPQ